MSVVRLDAIANEFHDKITSDALSTPIGSLLHVGGTDKDSGLLLLELFKPNRYL